MGRFRAPTLLAALCCAVIGVASAQGATAHGVQVSVLATFDAAHGPVAVAATNQGDVVALAGSSVVSIGPNGQQKTLTSIPGGAFGIPIGIAYDKSHQLYVALPESFGPPAAGTILTVSPNGKQTAAVPGSEGMIAPDGFGLDSSTGDLYVTDIYGMSIWRIGGMASPGRGRRSRRTRCCFSRTASRFSTARSTRRSRAGRSSGSRSTPTAARAPRRSGHRCLARCSSTTWCSTTAPATST